MCNLQVYPDVAGFFSLHICYFRIWVVGNSSDMSGFGRLV